MKFMLDIKTIYTLIGKELRHYFNNPTAYVVMVVFLVLWEFLFFRDAFVVGEASLRGLFTFLPWLYLLLIPALTMGSISDEQQNGTLEFLLTHPVRRLELVIAKYKAALAFVALTLLAVVPISISFAQYGSIDWGVVFAQYLSALLLASVLISIGVMVSVFLRSNIAVLLVTAAVSFLLIISGSPFFTDTIPLSVVRVVEQLSVMPHYESMLRGVIELRDVWYFISATIVFLSIAYLQLLKQKYGNRQTEYRSYQIGVLLFIGIAVLTNVIGTRIPGRIDISQSQAYTLSGATTDIVTKLSDVVSITAYISSQLPAQVQPDVRDTKAILRDYQNYSNGKVSVEIKDPSNDQAVAQEAASLGITQIEFNVIGSEELQVKRGYFGLAVSYAGENEVVPVIRTTSDLEYQITSYINKLTSTEKKILGFLTGHGEKTSTTDYTTIAGELSKQFELKEVTLDAENKAIPEEITVLIIAGPTQTYDDTSKEAIRSFINSGKSAFFLVDPVTVQPEALSASEATQNLTDILSEYGVTVNKDLVYDLSANQTVNFGSGGLTYLIPYPLWISAQAADEASPLTAQINQLMLPWASSISIDENKTTGLGLQVAPLFQTTEQAGSQVTNFNIMPDQQFSDENLSQKIVAVSLAGSDKENSAQKARLLVVSDAEFLSDQFLSNSPENAAFGLDAISWLGQEESLAEIQVKQRRSSALIFDDETQIMLVKYGNLAAAVLVPALFGVYWLSRRRQLKTQSYNSHG